MHTILSPAQPHKPIAGSWNLQHSACAFASSLSPCMYTFTAQIKWPNKKSLLAQGGIISCIIPARLCEHFQIHNVCSYETSQQGYLIPMSAVSPVEWWQLFARCPCFFFHNLFTIVGADNLCSIEIELWIHDAWPHGKLAVQDGCRWESLMKVGHTERDTQAANSVLVSNASTLHGHPVHARSHPNLALCIY